MSGQWTADDASRHLRRPTDRDDKYSRGVVGFRTGSAQYPGAAVLGVEAAWRTGVGMVRYLGPETARTLVLQRRPETVTVDGRVQAWVVGSGTPVEEDETDAARAVREIFAGRAPIVVDAGALDHSVGAAAPCIVTPHDREHDRLRSRLGLEPADENEREASALHTASALRGVVVLKGAHTIVATPSGWSTVVAAGTPWLATAGTGDVLAGVIGAIVASALATGAGGHDRKASSGELGELAATGVWLHGRAATIAAHARGAEDGPITALDVAEALPAAVSELLARTR